MPVDVYVFIERVVRDTNVTPPRLERAPHRIVTTHRDGTVRVGGHRGHTRPDDPAPVRTAVVLQEPNEPFVRRVLDDIRSPLPVAPSTAVRELRAVPGYPLQRAAVRGDARVVDRHRMS